LEGAERMQQRLADLRAGLEVHAQLVGFYRENAANVKPFENKNSGDGAQHAQVSSRVRELVEQFTILAHKQLLSGCEQNDVYAGDDGGSLTLF
jgi:hypothetical protein